MTEPPAAFDTTSAPTAHSPVSRAVFPSRATSTFAFLISLPTGRVSIWASLIVRPRWAAIVLSKPLVGPALVAAGVATRSVRAPRSTLVAVSITVSGVGEANALNAIDDLATVVEDSGATVIDVLANDTSTPPGAMLAIAYVSPAGHGSAASQRNAAFTKLLQPSSP